MNYNKEILKLIEHFESLHDGDLNVIGLQPKMCPAGYWTEGYGNVIRDPSGRMLKGKSDKDLAYKYTLVNTKEDAEKQLYENIESYAKKVEKICYRHNFKPNENEFAALISISYNCGTGCLDYIIPRLQNGEQVEKVFGMWNKSAGIVLKGLVIRRASEAYFYRTGKFI
jgi:lysozyme